MYDENFRFEIVKNHDIKNIVFSVIHKTFNFHN